MACSAWYNDLNRLRVPVVCSHYQGQLLSLCLDGGNSQPQSMGTCNILYLTVSCSAMVPTYPLTRQYNEYLHKVSCSVVRQSCERATHVLAAATRSVVVHFEVFTRFLELARYLRLTTMLMRYVFKIVQCLRIVKEAYMYNLCMTSNCRRACTCTLWTHVTRRGAKNMLTDHMSGMVQPTEARSFDSLAERSHSDFHVHLLRSWSPLCDDIVFQTLSYFK